MSNIDKIRQEIERLYDGEVPSHDQQCDFGDGYFEGLATILNFIDSLPEEKPSEELEEVARLYADNQIPTDYPDYFCRQDIKDAFIAGAECGIKSQEKKIADAYEKGKQEGIRIVRSWESSPGQCGY